MRLAIVRRHLRDAGGAERFIVETARALSGMSVDVTLLSEAVDAGARPVADWIRLPPGRGSRARKYRVFQGNVAKANAGGTFDIVQTHERILGADVFRVGDGVHAAWIERLKRHRTAWRRPWLDLDAYHRLLMRTERAMARESEVMFVANSAMIAGEIDAWLGVPAERIRVIENGVDLDRFAPPTAGERTEARKQLGLSADDRVVSFVGSGFERKGAFDLAAAMALPSMARMKLLVAGRDKHAAALLRSAGRNGNVRLLGPVDDVLPVLHASDVFALPTLYDPMPNAAIEAIACGLPVITTRDAGIAEHVARSGAGVVVPRDPDSIAWAIDAVFDRLEEARAAACDLRVHFNMNEKTQEWIDLYKEMMQR